MRRDGQAGPGNEPGLGELSAVREPSYSPRAGEIVDKL